MRFESELFEARLVRRYRRFFADVELADGRVVTVHCPNPGSMRGCMPARARVLVTLERHPRRRLPGRLELVKVARIWVGVNTGRANRVVEEALRAGRIPALAGFDELRREVRYGRRSRVDFLLRFGPRHCYVEVKNVTLAEGATARFPDSVTARGTRHLEELTAMRRRGHRAVLLYLVSRGDCQRVEAAADIDPVYAHTLRRARRAGVEVLAVRARVGRRGIRVGEPLRVSD